jgi:hypothetical protein
MVSPGAPASGTKEKVQPSSGRVVAVRGGVRAGGEGEGKCGEEKHERQAS